MKQLTPPSHQGIRSQLFAEGSYVHTTATKHLCRFDEQQQNRSTRKIILLNYPEQILSASNTTIRVSPTQPSKDFGRPVLF